VVAGGGTHGPGGAVVILRRVDGTTPRPRATRVRAVLQKDKRFVPHVLAVPVGATVEFRNEDELFHNVFSLSRPNDFDLGLYKGGGAREQVFNTPGPVHLLCNIHASMNGWIYVVDSPFFAQADATGRFAIRNVPEGAWRAEVWHEWSTRAVTKDLKVSAGMAELALVVDGDKQPPAFVPDKSGKPRQPQLGY
jgi:plastocyanin